MTPTAIGSLRTNRMNAPPGDPRNWIDDVLADSFPASDPPSWTPGMARPAPTTRTKTDDSARLTVAPRVREAHLPDEARMLRPRDLIPHFEVTNLQGETVVYSTIWQRRNLVLVTLPASAPDGAFRSYVSEIAAEVRALIRHDTECVITRDTVIGIPCPGVVIADRWGEIVHVASGSQVADLPHPREVVEWVTYVQHQCPECQGEVK
jgi:hypothetical protein